MIDLQEFSGLPIQADPERQKLIPPDGLEPIRYRMRKLHDLDAVWCSRIDEANKPIYWYSDGLTYTKDKDQWNKANTIYGIVFFYPGCFNNEFVKSSGRTSQGPF